MQVVVTAVINRAMLICMIYAKVAAADRLSCIMITYPSTHGVYEETVGEICDIVHQYGTGLS